MKLTSALLSAGLAITLSLTGCLMGSTAYAETSTSTEESVAAQDAENTEQAVFNDAADSGDATDSSDSAYVENSFRYENGSLRDDLINDFEMESNFSSARAMHRMPSAATAQGIDVSQWDGNIDWQQVKAAGIDFAIIKLGNLYYNDSNTDALKVDPYAMRNISECERLGIPYGIYVYSYGEYEIDYTIGAKTVASLLQSHCPSLPIYLDLEDECITPGQSEKNITNSDLTAFSKAFCNTIASYGYQPGIYASASWYENYLTDSCFYNSGWSIWTAQYWYGSTYYTGEDLEPYAPSEGSYDIWQYSSVGSVPGIDTDVDCNYAYFDLDSDAARNQKADELAAEHASDLADGVYEFSSTLKSSAVLEAANGGASSGTAVQLNASDSSLAQAWKVSHVGNYVVLTNEKSGLVLDCESGSRSSGTKLQLYAYNGSRAQLWIAVKISDGVYEFRSALDSEVTIDLPNGSTANGNRLQLYSSNSTSAQRWTVTACASKEDHADTLAAEHASDLADGTYTFASALRSSGVFDAASGGTSNGTAVQLYDSNDTAAQVWEVTHVGNYVVIKNAKSGLALDCPSGSSSSGTKLQLWEYNGSRAQKWVAVKQSDGSYELRSALNPEVAIDLSGAATSNGTRLQLYAANSTAAQRWTVSTYLTKAQKADNLASEHASDLSDGTYTVASSLRSNGVFDAASGGTSNGTAVQLYDSNGTGAQIWEISHEGNYAVIKNKKSGKVLDCPSGSSSSGTKLQLWEYNGSRAQKWVAVKLSDGSYEFHSALDISNCIDLSGAATSNGTRLQLYASNSTKAQRWSLSTYSEKSDTEKPLTGDLATDHAYDLADGTYTFVSSLRSNGVFDAANGGITSGTAIQLYDSNGTAAQVWQVSHVGNYVVIRNAKSGLALDCPSGSSASGTQLQLWEYNGTKAQLWVAVKQSDGSYELHSALNTDMCVDLSGAATSNGTRLQLYKSNSTGAQRWTVSTASSSAASQSSSASVTKTMTVTSKNGLNVRQSPSTNAAILGEFGYGEKVTVISEESNGWYKVKYGNTEGYCSADYLA